MDERDRQDGYVLGVLARLQFDREVCPLGWVDFDLLVQRSHLFPPVVRRSLDSLIERLLIERSGSDARLHRLTPAGVHLVKHRNDDRPEKPYVPE